MPIPKWLIWAFIVLSLIGFLDATYLTAKHYLGTPVNCSILEGCEEVTSSRYAVIGGIPVALLGTVYYLVIFLLAVTYRESGREIFLRSAVYVTPVGFLASLWFVYLQIFVIKAICLYCMGSALTSTMLFILGLLVYFKPSGKNT